MKTTLYGPGWRLSGNAYLDLTTSTLTIRIEAAFIDEDGYLADLAEVEQHTVEGVSDPYLVHGVCRALLPEWEWEAVFEHKYDNAYGLSLGGMTTCREIATTLEAVA